MCVAASGGRERGADGERAPRVRRPGRRAWASAVYCAHLSRWTRARRRPRPARRPPPAPAAPRPCLRPPGSSPALSNEAKRHWPFNQSLLEHTGHQAGAQLRALHMQRLGHGSRDLWPALWHMMPAERASIGSRARTACTTQMRTSVQPRPRRLTTQYVHRPLYRVHLRTEREQERASDGVPCTRAWQGTRAHRRPRCAAPAPRPGARARARPPRPPAARPAAAAAAA